MAAESDGLTLASATAPTAMPIRRLEMQLGQGQVLQMIGALIREADLMSGDRCTVQELDLFTKMTLGHFRHRSVESLVLAIREGMCRTDRDGKVYGKLTWPTLCVWLNDHDEAIADMAVSEHARSVVKNDNVGADYMDRMEHDAGAKDRKMEGMERTIDRLRKQLSNDKP